MSKLQPKALQLPVPNSFEDDLTPYIQQAQTTILSF